MILPSLLILLLFIQHIFLALLIFPMYSLFHIIVHALFKPMLFLLAGSPIHITKSFQSIYRIKLNNALITLVYILGVLILIFNYSKEAIIHSSNIEYASSFVCIIGLIGAVFTSMHSLKIYTIALIIGFYSNASGFPFSSILNSYRLQGNYIVIKAAVVFSFPSRHA